MKKIIITGLCILLCIVFVGCSAATPTADFSQRKPWRSLELNNSNYERITFDAERIEHKGTLRNTIANGTLEFRLIENGQGQTNLTTDLSLTHNSNSKYSGVDNISSEVSFSNDTLNPIMSTKNVSLVSSKNTNSYQTITDYAEKTSAITKDGTQKIFDLKGNKYFDNEMLYHLVRSINGLKSGAKYRFEIFTPFDTYANKSFFRHKILVSVAKNPVNIEVPKEIFDYAIPRSDEKPGKLADSGVYTIECLFVQIKLDKEKSGPPLYMYLSDLNFLDRNIDPTLLPNIYTKFVPIKIFNEEFSINGIREYTNEYTISSYSTIL